MSSAESGESGRAGGRRRSLLPREHGAYGEMAFPVLTGLTMAHPDIAAVGFSAAVVVAFLLYEPVAVLAGIRGPAARQELGGLAVRRAALLGGMLVLSAAVALWTASGTARWAALAPALGSAALLPAIATRRVKSLGGELIVAAILASALAPVAIAGGVTPRTAWTAVVVWAGAFWLGTLSVHAIKARSKREAAYPWARAAAPLAAVSVGGAALWSGQPEGLAVLPPVGIVLIVTLGGVHARHLRRVGWSLVVAYLATWILLITS